MKPALGPTWIATGDIALAFIRCGFLSKLLNGRKHQKSLNANTLDIMIDLVLNPKDPVATKLPNQAKIQKYPGPSPLWEQLAQLLQVSFLPSTWPFDLGEQRCGRTCWCGGHVGHACFYFQTLGSGKWDSGWLFPRTLDFIESGLDDSAEVQSFGILQSETAQDPKKPPQHTLLNTLSLSVWALWNLHILSPYRAG